MHEKILTQDFYLQDTVKVAEQLIGKKLVVTLGRKKLSGIIYETEAYLGLEDPACHSSTGLITPRTKTFYLKGGHSYIYLIYGMYFCFNIVTGLETQPEAVLIRALYPVEGLNHLKANSPHIQTIKKLADGPGKLCRSFAIDKTFNELPVFKASKVNIVNTNLRIDGSKIETSSRIGIDYAGDAAFWPLRFYYNPENLESQLSL
ncbi:MAG: DNA-3-methyladenine glycosylase [Bdellovibrionales bacterium]|nr:DNA-3-methyladenine glycosylase [Bdellovibrionales bacterium]